MKQLLMSILGYKEYLEWPFNQESIHKPITQYKLFGTKHTVKVWVLSFSPRLNYFIPVWLIFTQFNNFYFVNCNMSWLRTLLMGMYIMIAIFYFVYFQMVSLPQWMDNKCLPKIKSINQYLICQYMWQNDSTVQKVWFNFYGFDAISIFYVFPYIIWVGHSPCSVVFKNYFF